MTHFQVPIRLCLPSMHPIPVPLLIEEPLLVSYVYVYLSLTMSYTSGLCCCTNINIK